MDKDISSGIISTLISQPNYLLDILNIEKTELKYFASAAAIGSNNRVNVTRKGYKMGCVFPMVVISKLPKLALCGFRYRVISVYFCEIA